MSDFKFSDKLILQITIYFRDHYGIKISNTQAKEFLNSLAELYLSFWTIKQNKKNQFTKTRKFNSQKNV
jgi:hypothetical protein